MPIDPSAIITRWQDLKDIRNPFEPEWRKAALTCLPRQYGKWQTEGQGRGSTTGGSLTDSSAVSQGAREGRAFVHDTTAQRALPKYVALLGSLLTPQQQTWHTLGPDDPSLANIKPVQDYFSAVNDILFKMRYNPRAYFESAQFETYNSLGVYGTGVKFIAPRKKRPGLYDKGVIYRSLSMQHTWLAANDEGVVDTVFRIVPNMTARNARAAFPYAKLPPTIQAALDSQKRNELDTFEILHAVYPNEDYDPQALSVNRFPYIGVYIGVQDRFIIGEPEGYRVFPYTAARDYSDPSVVYGYSPAAMALGSIGTANAIKKTLIKQGQKAVDPPLLAFDDNSYNGRIGMHPGSIIYGGINQNGQETIKPVALGDFNIGQKMLEDEQAAINDSFFVSLYQILNENPDMTATEVMERSAEKAALLAPTMGRLQSSDLGPMIEREIDIAHGLGLLPEMPPELQEARGQYQVVYTSPLAKQQKSEQVAAFMRTAQWAAQAAQQTGDPSLMARFNFNEALPDILEAQGVPSNWINSDEVVAQMTQAKQQAQQAEMASKAAPALAGAAKAQAVVQQAQGGQKSAQGAAPAPAVEPISIPQ